MKELVLKSYRIAHKRGWNKIYWAVDIHDVILEANYKAGDIPTTFLGNAKEVLQRLSKRSDCCLILFTCSFPHEIEQYLEFFKKNDIHFKYVNENPECPNTAFGFFERKFYFNILLEDKAGFVPRNWNEITEALDIVDKTVVATISSVGKATYWYASKVGETRLVTTTLDPFADKLGYTLCEFDQEEMHFQASDCTVQGRLDLSKNAERSK